MTEATQEPVAEKKPFDLKDLAERLKAKGLPDVEALARDVVESVFEWTEDGVKLTPTKLDDFALILFPTMKKYVLRKVDEISPAAAPESPPSETL